MKQSRNHHMHEYFVLINPPNRINWDVEDIEFEFEKQLDFSYRLYSAIGELLLDGSIPKSVKVNKKLNLSKLSVGIYYMFFDIGNKTYSHKITIHK